MRKITLVLIPMLLASTAFASSSVVVDIVGSNTDNTQIIQPNAGSIELEIIGSMTKNTSIASQARVNTAIGCRCPEKDKHFCKPNQAQQIPHMGVDAWYGKYWYTSINMPKWPQL